MISIPTHSVYMAYRKTYYVINIQIHFYSFDSDSKISLPPRLCCPYRNGQSPHTLIFVSHSPSSCLRPSGNCHIYRSEYPWKHWTCRALCGFVFLDPEAENQNYQRTVPHVLPKGDEQKMKSTGLILLCWQQHLNDPRGQRSHCKVFTDSAFQSKVPFLQSLLHSSQENAS